MSFIIPLPGGPGTVGDRRARYTQTEMAYKDLREFIAALERNGELKRIPFEVDPVLEITEFADRAVKRGGPALLFEKPTGSMSGAHQRLRFLAQDGNCA